MKRKCVICLGMLLIIGFSIFFAYQIKADESGTTPVLSIVPTGDAGSSVTSYIPQAAIGSQFTVDVRLDNASFVSGGIDGATYGVIYNPAVLDIVSTADGSCWGSHLVSTDVAVNSSEYDFAQTILDTANASATIEPDNDVVLGQIIFQVIGSGQSNITFDISPSGQLFYLVSPTIGNIYPTGTSTGFAYANAIFVSSSPSQNSSIQNPVARFSPADGSIFLIGSTVTLNANSSQPGYENNQTLNITDYLWGVEYLNGTTFTSLTGEITTFNASVEGTFRIILIITANDTADSASAIINVVQSFNLQVFTDADTYGPLQLVQIYGLATDQNVSVPGALVDFSIQCPNGSLISTVSNVTNGTGIAYTNFRLPDPNPTENLFGNWSITASATVLGQIAPVSDTESFTFTYLSEVENITIPTSVNVGETMSIQLTINNDDMIAPFTGLCITIFDNASVPIASSTIPITQLGGNLTIIDAAVTIPLWAFPGEATAYVCLLTNSSAPLSPESAANFLINP